MTMLSISPLLQKRYGLRKAAIAVLQPGEHVEVFDGEQACIHAVVDKIVGDVVTFTAKGIDLEGQKMEMLARSVRKRFKSGDHVKVMTGQNAGEMGLVVSVADNVVTFVSDMTNYNVEGEQDIGCWRLLSNSPLDFSLLQGSARSF